MKIEDLFKYGVTPKNGENAGKKYKVLKIEPKGVFVSESEMGPRELLPHGTYDIWREPKTIFEDDTIPVTWGNLKKAVEQAGLKDDTKIMVTPELWPSVVSDADAKIVEVNGERAILFY